MNKKAEIKKRVYTVWLIKRRIVISYRWYQLRSAMGLKTRGNSSFRFLAFNRILKGSLGQVLSIGVVRGEDFSEPELIRLQKWSFKNPENHIVLFVHPYKRACKVVAGEKYVSIINTKETKSQEGKATALFQDKQFIKGVHEMAEYIRSVIKTRE